MQDNKDLNEMPYAQDCSNFMTPKIMNANYDFTRFSLKKKSFVAYCVYKSEMWIII